MRFLLLGAQGVFWNAFFISYVLNPKICHRFVGALEEEAIGWSSSFQRFEGLLLNPWVFTVTYTHLLKEMELGRVPEWDNKRAPQIAIDYWRMAEDATMLDMIYAVRADESSHRFCNHTWANLQPGDPNPFALKEPSVEVKGTLPGFTREQALAWTEEIEQKAKSALKQDVAKQATL